MVNPLLLVPRRFASLPTEGGQIGVLGLKRPFVMFIGEYSINPFCSKLIFHLNCCLCCYWCERKTQTTQSVQTPVGGKFLLPVRELSFHEPSLAPVSTAANTLHTYLQCQVRQYDVFSAGASNSADRSGREITLKQNTPGPTLHSTSSSCMEQNTPCGVCIYL